MLKIRHLNPEILPSKSGRSTDHHKFITAAVLAAVGMLVIGGLYWWMGQKKITDISLIVPINNERVVLSPEESQKKIEAISSVNSEQVKLTPEEKKKKEATLMVIQVK